MCTNCNLISDGGSDGDTAVISKANSGMYRVYINHTENERNILMTKYKVK